MKGQGADPVAVDVEVLRPGLASLVLSMRPVAPLAEGKLETRANGEVHFEASARFPVLTPDGLPGRAERPLETLPLRLETARSLTLTLRLADAVSAAAGGLTLILFDRQGRFLGEKPLPLIDEATRRDTLDDDVAYATLQLHLQGEGRIRDLRLDFGELSPSEWPDDEDRGLAAARRRLVALGSAWNEAEPATLETMLSTALTGRDLDLLLALGDHLGNLPEAICARAIGLVGSVEGFELRHFDALVNFAHRQLDLDPAADLGGTLKQLAMLASRSDRPHRLDLLLSRRRLARNDPNGQIDRLNDALQRFGLSPIGLEADKGSVTSGPHSGQAAEAELSGPAPAVALNGGYDGVQTYPAIVDPLTAGLAPPSDAPSPRRLDAHEAPLSLYVREGHWLHPEFVAHMVSALRTSNAVVVTAAATPLVTTAPTWPCDGRPGVDAVIMDETALRYFLKVRTALTDPFSPELHDRVRKKFGPRSVRRTEAPILLRPSV